MKKHQLICEDPPTGNSVILFSAAENIFLQDTAAANY